MGWMNSFWLRLLALGRRKRLESDLEEEMAHHLAMRQRRLAEGGMNDDDARAEARRRFGNATLRKEELRDEWTFRWLEVLVQDGRFALRMMRKSAGFSALVVAIVAISVGASTTIWSVVEKALLWNENPNVDRWVVVRPFFAKQNLRGNRLAIAEYYDVRGLTDVFERVGAVSGFNGAVYIDGAPQYLQATHVSSEMIPMTSIAAMMGRTFSEADDKPGAAKTTVLTYEFWQNRLHGEPGILGKDLRIDNDHYTVIGIMPPNYGLWGGELYVPFQLDAANTNRTNRNFWVVALIRRHVSQQQVDARLAQTAREWASAHRTTNPEYDGLILSTWNIKEAVIAGVRPALVISMAVVGLIVLIACANIGNLLLARANGRRREMAVRAALGAPRNRIIRQLLTESLLLAMVGGALGAVLAYWGVPAAVALVPVEQLPNQQMIKLDGGALALGIAVATLMGVTFGLAPAFYSARGDLARAVREGGMQAGGSREARWARSALIVAQIALAMVVMAGAGLMIRTYREFSRLDVGYNPHNALSAQLVLPASKYATGEKVDQFYRELTERLRATPGVDGVAVSTGHPLMDRVVDLATQDFNIVGQDREKAANANMRVVSTGFFEVAGMRLLRGRLLSESDTATSQPVAVINQTMAKVFWPGKDAVGETIRLGAPAAEGLGSGDNWTGREVKIVGVVGDSRQVRYLDAPIRQEIFFALEQRPSMANAVTLIVRSRMSTDTLTEAVRKTVVAIDPERPIFNVETLDQAVSDMFGPKRMATVLLGLFAAVAITLASIGLYGLMAYTVEQRTRDIGIRMALGASPSDVLRMVLGEGWRMAWVGLGVGVISALAGSRFMRSLVFDVSPTDPATYFVTAVLLTIVALVACYVPARRATRIDPMIALRYE